MKHGGCEERLYRIWKGMKQRCYNINNPYYKNYGGRGITIFSDWVDNYAMFRSWAFENGYSEGGDVLTIDRINNDLGYAPTNCRWITRFVQMQNTRLLIKTNTSGYRGVSFKKDRQKWKAYISINHKQKHLGYFDNKDVAALAYNTFVLTNNLEFPLNVIPPKQP